MSDKKSDQRPRWTTNPNIAMETCGSGYPFGTNTVNEDYRYTRQGEMKNTQSGEDGGSFSDTELGYESDYSPTGDSDHGYEEDDVLNMKACSAMECTGLIPSLPLSDSELESYAEIYHYPADVFRD